MLGLFNEFNLKLRNPNNGKIEAALYYNILQYQPRILQANIQNKMKTKESKIQNKDENKPSSFEKTRSLSPKSLGQLLTKDTSFSNPKNSPYLYQQTKWALRYFLPLQSAPQMNYFVNSPSCPFFYKCEGLEV